MSDRLVWYQKVIDSGLIPLFYHENSEVARQIALALVEGGAVAVEFTNRGQDAFRVFQKLVDETPLRTETSLGVGSIIDAPTAALFITAGAQFIVGPTFNVEVAQLCNRRKIPYLPGCSTPTEISTAEEWGVEIVKIFPGRLLGPSFVSDVLAPMPWSRLMPTGGIQLNADNLQKWFSAGVCCVGMGSDLVRKDLVADANYRGISKNMSIAVKLIEEVRN